MKGTAKWNNNKISETINNKAGGCKVELCWQPVAAHDPVNRIYGTRKAAEYIYMYLHYVWKSEFFKGK